MVRNVVVKNILKNSVFKLFNLLNAVVPKRGDTIMLYSANKGVGHNLVPLKKYLLEHGYQKQYKIICGIEKMKYAGSEADVVYVPRGKACLLFLRTKYVFYTTGQIPIKPSKTQKVVQMFHGIPSFKSFGKLSHINNGNEFYFTSCLATSEFYRPITMQALGCKEENVFICGEPMVDAIFEPAEKIDFGNYKKIILWCPTFRQSDYLGYDNSSLKEYLPMFSEAEYEELNGELGRRDFLLLVKLHPAQNLGQYRDKKFSHLKIYSHDDFLAAGLELYRLLPQVDVLLADYSTVSMQFYLLNRPIGFVVPDMEEYAEKRGFAFEHPEEFMAGEIIRTKEELYRFFEDIANGRDRHSSKRERVKNLLHKYQEGGNCKRILEYVGLPLPEKQKP